MNNLPLARLCPLCAALVLLAFFTPGCATAPGSAAKAPPVAEIDRRDGAGRTQLIRAARKGNVALMRGLLERGAKTDIQDAHGYDALMFLVEDDTYRNDAVALLLDHHADTNLVNFEGNSALMIAASKQSDPKDAESQYRLIKQLLDAGADPDSSSRLGLYPVHLSAAAGQPGPCIDLLLKATSKHDLIALGGYSVLSEAALNDQRSAEDYLIGEGMAPQDLPPLSKDESGPSSWPPRIDDTFAVNARSFEAYGDFLQAHGKADEAHGFYSRSSAQIPSAVSEYKDVLGLFQKALAKEKAARTARVVDLIGANIIGAGLGVATGVGVAFIPRRGAFHNRIDEYEDEIDRLKQQLASLDKEGAAVSAKIGPPLPAAPLATLPGR